MRGLTSAVFFVLIVFVVVLMFRSTSFAFCFSLFFARAVFEAGRIALAAETGKLCVAWVGFRPFRSLTNHVFISCSDGWIGICGSLLSFVWWLGSTMTTVCSPICTLSLLWCSPAAWAESSWDRCRGHGQGNQFIAVAQVILQGMNAR